jgi:dUTP pyrophosphatase
MEIPYTGTDPSYSHYNDAGADLLSTEEFYLAPNRSKLVSTGTAIALPDGYAAFVMPRSGLAAKHGITVLNSPGVVDAGYRGEIKVLLINHGSEVYKVSRGDKIAQLVIMPVVHAEFVSYENLDESERGDGGFGSTGYARA